MPDQDNGDDPVAASRSIGALTNKDIASVARLSAAPTTGRSFGAAFKTDPIRALASKGIILSDIEEKRVRKQVSEAIRGGRGINAATEVTVSVGVKF